jgi:hypothetical protein
LVLSLGGQGDSGTEARMDDVVVVVVVVVVSVAGC